MLEEIVHHKSCYCCCYKFPNVFFRNLKSERVFLWQIWKTRVSIFRFDKKGKQETMREVSNSFFLSPLCISIHQALLPFGIIDGRWNRMCGGGRKSMTWKHFGMQFHVGYFARSVTLIYKQYACDPYVFTLLGWLTHSRGKKKKFAIFVKQQYIPVSVFHACCILTNKSIIELSLTNKLAQISRRDLSNKFQLRIFVKNQKSITRKLLVTQERSLLNFNINQF